MIIRPASPDGGDADALWRILEPVIRAGETYPLPRDMDRAAALAYWLSPQHEVFVAIDSDPGRLSPAPTTERPPPRPSPVSEHGAGSFALNERGAMIHERSQLVGTYYLRANNAGGGAHVANCGYMVAAGAQGRGVARAMCAHSLARAKERGFRAIQYNFVIASNERAVSLWQAMGFAIVGRLPGAFAHPTFGFVDALVMWREV